MLPNTIIFKKGLLVIALLVLFFPIIQNNLTLINLYKLAGDNTIQKDTSLTISTFFTGTYQKKLEQNLKSDFGFRSLLIKINNQINFSFFNKINAQGVVAGKDNYLFETTYINSYLGNDFMGEDSINQNLSRLKNISDKLLLLNKHLILVIAPGKPSFYRDYLPDNLRSNNAQTNYSYIAKEIKIMELNCIDFSDWFNRIKMTAKYPLYPKHGNHWSTYGAYLAADSIIKFIEYKRGIDMPNLCIKNIKIGQPINEDKDIEYGINLLFKLKSFDLAYPELKTENSFGKTKPNILVIADSFFANLNNLGFANCFEKTSFWYYNKAVYPINLGKQLMVDDLNFHDEIIKHNIIVILATESNIKNLGWGFIENAEKYLN